jgi:hypothetical protein
MFSRKATNTLNAKVSELCSDDVSSRVPGGIPREHSGQAMSLGIPLGATMAEDNSPHGIQAPRGVRNQAFLSSSPYRPALSTGFNLSRETMFPNRSTPHTQRTRQPEKRGRNTIGHSEFRWNDNGASITMKERK